MGAPQAPTFMRAWGRVLFCFFSEGRRTAISVPQRLPRPLGLRHTHIPLWDVSRHAVGTAEALAWDRGIPGAALFRAPVQPLSGFPGATAR